LSLTTYPTPTPGNSDDLCAPNLPVIIAVTGSNIMILLITIITILVTCGILIVRRKRYPCTSTVLYDKDSKSIERIYDKVQRVQVDNITLHEKPNTDSKVYQKLNLDASKIEGRNQYAHLKK
jgi:hypothetical protein